MLPFTAVRTFLFINNFTICVNASIVLVVLYYQDRLSTLFDGWVMTCCKGLIIVVAVVSQLASVGMQISLQRDWVVVIAAGNKSKLASKYFCF